MVPRKPVYNHDRLVLQSTENSEAGGYFEDPKIEARTNTGGLFTPKKQQTSDMMSTYHKGRDNMDYTYLSRTKQAKAESKTRDIVSTFFDSVVDQRNCNNSSRADITPSRLSERVASAPSRNQQH